MLLTKEVEITINSKTFKHYKELGYEFEHTGETIVVKVEDLSKGSHVMVDILCDYCCREIVTIPYYAYLNERKLVDKVACKKCISLKRNDCNFLKYGVKNTTQLDWVKDKMTQTNYERYGVCHYSKTNDYKEKYKNTMMRNHGVEYALQNEEYKKKFRNTCMEHFGVDSPSKCSEVKDKMQKTFIEKYGVSNPMKSTRIKQRLKQSFLDKYGVENPNQLPEIREKTVKTLYKNSSQKVSTQQSYLHNLYGGLLNYPISYYSADICLPEEKIIIEYNGGGHMLNVITGRETQEEYNRKEIIRNNTVKRAGYKQITIISSKDFLPSDEILLKMLEQAKQYFNTTNHTWVEYNIDTSLMRNAENKEGVFFDFGELRKIKKAS